MPDGAYREAFSEMGGLDRVGQGSREIRAWVSSDRVAYDLRNGLRTLFRHPVLDLIVVTMLALGIGANTVLFSILSAVVLKPLPYKNSRDLVVVWQAAFRIAAQENDSPHTGSYF